jgi:pimeloyl-ACP methyl ester carboxylesterase
VRRFAERLKEFDSPVPVLDVSVLGKEVPLMRGPPSGTPVLVVGADEDIVVDVEGVRETADFFGVEPVILTGAAHDVMVDVRWQDAAEVLADWLRSLSQ